MLNSEIYQSAFRLFPLVPISKMMKKLSHATPCSNIVLKPAPERSENDDALLPLPVDASVLQCTIPY
jgi:hypothetical protein